jgi:GH25 family lysozyme M1 (1,4-beta-N-acetylmuramidase)
MTLTSIKSDIKIKFINSETSKLVANVHFTVSVVNPDGSKIEYDDHDMDGIIYKNNMTAGTYKITPNALSSEYEKYKLDTSTKSLTVKDTVEMKAVDVSNEIKKESQVNAAKEDTAVQEVVESVLTDTVDWVDSNQNSSTSSDGKYKYETIDKSTIADPSSSAKLTLGSVKRMAAARSRAKEPDPDNANNENSASEASSAASEASSAASEASTEAPSDSSAEAPSDSSTEATTEASSGGTTDSSSGSTTTEPERPKDMSVSLTNPSIKVGESTPINVSGPSSYEAKSDNESVAVASGNTVTAKAPGTAKITVKASGYNDGYVTVNVSEAAKKDMTLSVKELTIAIGEKGKITVSNGPSSFTCKSSDTKIATVANDGTITGVAEGKATITFSADGYNDAPATITVTKTGTKKLEMNVTKVTIVQGQTFKIAPKDTSLSVTYKSSDTNIATISGATITGVKEGKTTIVVSCTGYADTNIEVTVVSNKTVLKDKNGNTVYVKDSDGNYREATYDDYYNGKTFYLRKENDGVRQGWWTIDGKTYYYDKNGNKVTGEQVIKGAKYSFGSDGALSSSSGSMGIDVSKWNGNINWAQVKNAGVNYAIIRCGYRGSSAGALIEDPKFRANIKGAQAAGIKVGVYFFSQAINEVEAVEEASMCINLCKGYNLSFPVYIDVEASHGRGDQISASQRTANVKAFCGTIQSAGYRAGVYSNKTWFTQYMNASSLTSYKIWLAQYAANVTYTATRYDMWQYTSKGSISGISGNVDMNINYN